MIQGLLTLEKPENVYENYRPGYTESGKKKDAVVHNEFLSLLSKIHILQVVVDFFNKHF
jgi:hypothetical protein